VEGVPTSTGGGCGGERGSREEGLTGAGERECVGGGGIGWND